VGYKDGFGLINKPVTFRVVDFLRNIKSCFTNYTSKNKFNIKINEKVQKVIGVVGMYNTEIDISNEDIKIGDKVTIEINPIHLDTRIEREYIK